MMFSKHLAVLGTLATMVMVAAMPSPMTSMYIRVQRFDKKLQEKASALSTHNQLDLS